MFAVQKGGLFIYGNGTGQKSDFNAAVYCTHNHDFHILQRSQISFLVAQLHPEPRKLYKTEELVTP